MNLPEGICWSPPGSFGRSLLSRAVGGNPPEPCAATLRAAQPAARGRSRRSRRRRRLGAASRGVDGGAAGDFELWMDPSYPEATGFKAKLVGGLVAIWLWI